MTISGLDMSIKDDGPKTSDQKREVLESSKPKIVNPQKYHGPAVTDFRAIKDRMKSL